MGEMADFLNDESLVAAWEEGDCMDDNFRDWQDGKKIPFCRYCNSKDVFWQLVRSPTPNNSRREVWRLCNRSGPGFHTCDAYFQAKEQKRREKNREARQRKAVYEFRQSEQEAKREALCRSALAKLTTEEIKALGLDNLLEEGYTPKTESLDNSEHAAGGYYGQGGLGGGWQGQDLSEYDGSADEVDRAPYCDDWMWK